MSNWKLGRRLAACITCGREFEDGDAHFSKLALEAGELCRIDVCLECWPQADSSGNEPGAPVGSAAESEANAQEDEPLDNLVWWRARRRISGKRALAVDIEGLEQIFTQLESAAEERLIELRYVLALLLMRKRRLFMVRAVRRGDEEFLAVRRPRRQEEILVAVRDLAPERMESIRADLERLFEGGDLEAEAEASATPEPAPE